MSKAALINYTMSYILDVFSAQKQTINLVIFTLDYQHCILVRYNFVLNVGGWVSYLILSDSTGIICSEEYDL